MIIDFTIIQSLDRAVSPMWRTGSCVNLASVSEMDLRYEYFWSEIEFVVDGYDLGTHWGRVPLLDFAASAKRILGSLDREGHGEMDFTESSMVVSFVRCGEFVEIVEVVAGRSFSCGFDELVNAVLGFMHKVSTVLMGDHPDIGRNKFFKTLTSNFDVT